MPIIVSCPRCATKLSAPDAAIGKNVRCPKCQTLCPVPAPAASPKSPPAFEVVDASPPPKPKAVAKARALPIPDDDKDDRPRGKKRAVVEDDDDDFEPRRRKSKREEAGSGKSSALMIGGIVAGVFLILGVGFATYWFGVRGKPAKTSDDRADRADGGGNGPAVAVNPEQWETYTAPKNVFRASFPGKPEGKEYRPFGRAQVVSDFRSLQLGDGTHLQKPGLFLFAGYVRFPEGASPNEVVLAKSWINETYVVPRNFRPGDVSGNSPQSAKTVSIGGREWVEERKEQRMFDEQGFVRWHQAGSILHVVGYKNRKQELPKEIVDKFLNSHEILGGDLAEPEPGAGNNWQEYTSPDNVFRASFPGETTVKKRLFTGALASEFREFVVKDEKGGTAKSYVAGYVRFPQNRPPLGLQDLREFLKDLTGLTSLEQRVAFAGWPWAEERQSQTGNGFLRLIEADSTVYVVAISGGTSLLSRQEIDKFFNSFAILDAKPEQNNRIPPGWARYTPKGGGFQALLPRQARQEDIEKLVKEFNLPITSVAKHRANDLNHELSVIVVRFAAGASEAEQKRVLLVMTNEILRGASEAKLRNSDKITWAGREWEELTYTPEDRIVIRQSYDSDIAYIVGVRVYNGKLNPDLARVFFDNFSLPKRK